MVIKVWGIGISNFCDIQVLVQESHGHSYEHRQAGHVAVRVILTVSMPILDLRAMGSKTPMSPSLENPQLINTNLTAPSLQCRSPIARFARQKSSGLKLWGSGGH